MSVNGIVTARNTSMSRLIFSAVFEDMVVVVQNRVPTISLTAPKANITIINSTGPLSS
jgi:hypothetical protein